MYRHEGVEQERLASMIIAHENYGKDFFGQSNQEQNDICMIKVRQPFLLNNHVSGVDPLYQPSYHAVNKFAANAGSEVEWLLADIAGRTCKM